MRGGLVAAAGAVLHVHQRVGGGASWVGGEAVPGMLWLSVTGGVAHVEHWHHWFAPADLCLSGHVPLSLALPQGRRLSWLLKPSSLGPVRALQWVGMERVECSN